MIVLLEDLHALHYCNPGNRLFFRRMGWNWSDFIKNGVDADVLFASGDHMALAAIKQAEKRLGVTHGR